MIKLMYTIIKNVGYTVTEYKLAHFKGMQDLKKIG